MRIARFAKGDGVAYGVVEGAGSGVTVAELHGHPFGVDPGGVRLTGHRYPLAEVRLLAPVLPSKVVGAGRNYPAHAQEMNGEPPVEPVLFLKPSTSVTGPGDAPDNIRLKIRRPAEIDVYWDPPKIPNGKIVRYIIYYTPLDDQRPEYMVGQVPSKPISEWLTYVFIYLLYIKYVHKRARSKCMFPYGN